MDPVVIELGPLTLRAYNAWLLGGALVGLGIIGWRARRVDPGRAVRWLDVALVALVAAVIGARGLGVALDGDRFATSPHEIVRLSLGGMAWHGAPLAGLPAALIAAWLRGVPFRAWTDAAALAWPPGMIAAWAGCRDAGCGAGYEVATLAGWPGWLVAELPDAYGFVAPRLDVQSAGMLFGGALWALAALLTWRGWLRGLRLWLLLGLSGLGLAVLGFLRADYAPVLLDRRADQVFDLALLLVSAVIGGVLWLRDRRKGRSAGGGLRGPLA
ncbi:MAG: prolipoprotein diacylglyceryl transferase [Anaerolineae bacterium]|nr:prolipoprotein diacylglyceryl transferase [Anaerolineae bacterium]